MGEDLDHHKHASAGFNWLDTFDIAQPIVNIVSHGAKSRVNCVVVIIIITLEQFRECILNDRSRREYHLLEVVQMLKHLVEVVVSVVHNNPTESPTRKQASLRQRVDANNGSILVKISKRMEHLAWIDYSKVDFISKDWDLVFLSDF